LKAEESNSPPSCVQRRDYEIPTEPEGGSGPTFNRTRPICPLEVHIKFPRKHPACSKRWLREVLYLLYISLGKVWSEFVLFHMLSSVLLFRIELHPVQLPHRPTTQYSSPMSILLGLFHRLVVLPQKRKAFILLTFVARPPLPEKRNFN